MQHRATLRKPRGTRRERNAARRSAPGTAASCASSTSCRSRRRTRRSSGYCESKPVGCVKPILPKNQRLLDRGPNVRTAHLDASSFSARRAAELGRLPMGCRNSRPRSRERPISGTARVSAPDRLSVALPDTPEPRAELALPSAYSAVAISRYNVRSGRASARFTHGVPTRRGPGRSCGQRRTARPLSRFLLTAADPPIRTARISLTNSAGESPRTRRHGSCSSPARRSTTSRLASPARRWCSLASSPGLFGHSVRVFGHPAQIPKRMAIRLQSRRPVT